MIRLEFKPTAASRVWRKSSLSMHPAGLENMAATAAALVKQEGWHNWRIVDDSGRVLRESEA